MCSPSSLPRALAGISGNDPGHGSELVLQKFKAKQLLGRVQLAGCVLLAYFILKQSM